MVETRKTPVFLKKTRHVSQWVSAPTRWGGGLTKRRKRDGESAPLQRGPAPTAGGCCEKTPDLAPAGATPPKATAKPTKSRPEWPVNYEREIACEQACRSGVSDHPRRRRHRSRGNGARREYRKSASLGQAAGSTASTTRCERGPADPCASTRIAAAETQKQRPAQRPQDTEQVAPRHDSWPDPRRTRQRRPVMIR